MIIMTTMLSSCAENADNTVYDNSTETSGNIFLYGEQHGVEKIIDKEFELWSDYYHNDGMRHLFIENSYYGTEFLNLWMDADNDDILDDLFKDLVGTAADNPYSRQFYINIKNECPETIFHGTDVGHQYRTTGAKYLSYLEDNNLKDSEQYKLTLEAIEQGKKYYNNYDHVYRENMMYENFIREFNNLNDESIMGIYGGAHTKIDGMDYYTNSVPNMANQLHTYYGDLIKSEDLSYLTLMIDPLSADTININGKDYEASYFGKIDLSYNSAHYIYGEFWRLENAYNDFKDMPSIDDYLPHNNYPMIIEDGQVFVNIYTKTDGSTDTLYFRSDGNFIDNLPITNAFSIE